MANNRKRVKNFITLEFISLSENAEIAKAAISALARQMTPPPTLDDISNIQTAVSEAVDNAIIHAYPTHLGSISIKAAIINGNILEVFRRILSKKCHLSKNKQK